MSILRISALSFHPAFCLLGLLAVLRSPAAGGDVPGRLDVLSFGAKADGATDDTAAIQKALDAAGKSGGIVAIPPGKYRVEGSLKVPAGVAV